MTGSPIAVHIATSREILHHHCTDLLPPRQSTEICSRIVVPIAPPISTRKKRLRHYDDLSPPKPALKIIDSFLVAVVVLVTLNLTYLKVLVALNYPSRLLSTSLYYQDTLIMANTGIIANSLFVMTCFDRLGEPTVLAVEALVSIWIRVLLVRIWGACWRRILVVAERRRTMVLIEVPLFVCCSV